jgi:SAM-dependent methyltransferase
MIANMSGLITNADSPVGRRNKLHVPHDAAASVTITMPPRIERRSREATVLAISGTTSPSRRDSMPAVTYAERFVRAFHDANPGITSRAFARGGSYEQLARRVPRGRVLDLACGDGELLGLLGPEAIGIDFSLQEARRGRTRGRDVLQARAQALPFRDHAFDAVTCHLAFMLFDDIELVVAELGRVLKPGAPFIALLGGGPTADGDDAFHHFVDLLSMSKAAGPISNVDGFGDRRATTEAGWRELFAGWSEPTFERWPLDLGGNFDDVWTFLASNYQLRDRERIRDQLRAAYPGDHVPCTVVTYCATVTG